MALNQNQAINIRTACTTNDLTRFAEAAQGCDINAELIWVGRRIGISGFHNLHRTPLMLAASYGSVNVAERILNTPGVDVNRYSSTDNLTALDCLLVYEPPRPQNDAIHRMLLDCGAQYRHPENPGGYVHNTYMHTVRHDCDLDPLDWSCETANFMIFEYKMSRCLYGNRCLGENRCPYWHNWYRERRRDLRVHNYSTYPCFFYPHCNNPGCEFAHGYYETKFHPDQFRTRVCVGKMMCLTRACSYYHNWVECRAPVWRRPPPTFTLDLMPSSSHIM